MIKKYSLFKIVKNDFLNKKFFYFLLFFLIIVSSFFVVLITHKTRLLTNKMCVLIKEKEYLEYKKYNLIIKKDKLENLIEFYNF